MNQAQKVVVGIAVLLFLLLYFGFDTKSVAQRDELDQRALAGTKIDVEVINKAAKESLTAEDLREIEQLERLVEFEDQPAEQIIANLKTLSGRWYRQERYLLAGHYAEMVAERQQTDTAWGIAGTTYIAGIGSTDPAVKSGCFGGAIRSLENAISIDPSTVGHRVNLALAYAEHPPPDNPMRGIQMLLKLNEDHPDNIAVLTTLGRLAIKTGQYERAATRLERALAIDPQRPAVNCLLAEAYQQLGDLPRSRELREKCEILTSKE